MNTMTPDTKLALDCIARTKAILDSIPDDERALCDAYSALEAADSTHWKVDTSEGVALHSSRLAAAWHAFRAGNGYVFAWRNSCETLEIDLRWLKRILHWCSRFFKRIFRMYEVGAWLDASSSRRDWNDQAGGWIPPTDNNF